MDGMGMMLKAMGLDPDEFKQFMIGFQTTMQKFNADLEAIKLKQIELEQNQRAILAAVVKPPVEEYVHG